MEAISSKRLIIILISSLLIILFTSDFITHNNAQATGGRPHQQASTVFIKSSCSSTTYPRLCYSSLVKHADLIQTNRVVLTGTALNVTLSSAKSTSAAMSILAKRRGLKPREVEAMKDCVEELHDSVDQLRRSIGEMGNLMTSNFELTMSDVQTWVSAALTDESTCTDGFQDATTATASATEEDDIKTTVRGRIVKLAQLTSNALALINQLAISHA